jgi:hypothetical protein
MPNQAGDITADRGANAAQTEVADIPPSEPVSATAQPLGSPAVPSMPSTVTATVVAQPSRATPEPEPRIFIEENFDVPSDEWPSRTTATSNIEYVDGLYQMTLSGQTGLAVIQNIPFDNYRLKFDVAVQEGGAGILFLTSGPDVFYRFVVTSEGAFSIQLEDRANQTITNLVDWTESQALQRQPGETNRLRLEREGQTIRFFADDQLLTDFSIPEGAVAASFGLAVTSRTGEGQAMFDNLYGERLSE